MNAPFDLATVEAPFFEPLAGQKFIALPLDTAGPEPLELELTHVQEFHHRVEAGRRAPFSLLFKPHDPARMAQGTYQCSGPGVDAAIFLVPVRDPLRGLCMEAVFN